jgi:hypothetical protein
MPRTYLGGALRLKDGAGVGPPVQGLEERLEEDAEVQGLGGLEVYVFVCVCV